MINYLLEVVSFTDCVYGSNGEMAKRKSKCDEKDAK